MTIKKTIREKLPQDVEIESLEVYEQSRRRTEMWLGSRAPHTQSILSYNPTLAPREITWVPALFTAYREVIDNAIDEMITHGHGDRLDITYNSKTTTFKIADNGRGIPISIHPKEGIHQATLALSKTFSGRNFNDDTRGASRGVNGVGASIVNFCSEWFKLDITRDKKTFHQTFSEGTTELKIEDPLILPAVPKAPTGTTITFKLSKKVFSSMVLPEEFIRDRVFEVALCYPKLKVFYQGKQVKTMGPEKTLFAGKKPITFEINDQGFRSRFWLLPEFLETSGEHAHGLVNAIPVFNGGAHIDAFKRLFYAGMSKSLERTSKQKKLTPNRSDFADGMLIYNITEMDTPAFDSQSKTRLINENVGKIIQTALDDPDFFKGVVKRNPEWIESVYERCRDRTQKKDDKEIATVARNNRKKVEKLTDATGSDRSKCVILLAEGDCLHEETEVLVVDEAGDLKNLQIGSLEVSSLVVSHANRICRVKAITKKVAKTIEIETTVGIIKCTEDHRMLCHDRMDDEFKWVKAKDIIMSRHRFVKNKISANCNYAEITVNQATDDLLFTREIRYIDPYSGELLYQLSSDDHYFGVFDTNTMIFTKIQAKYIDPNIHLFLIEG